MKRTDKIDLAAVYELPASLVFAESCLGVCTPVRIAGLEGEVRLPSVEWTPDNCPYVTAPLLNDLPAAAAQLLLDKHNHPDNPWFWGTVDSWRIEPKGIHGANVNALLFRFSTVNSQCIKYSNYLYGRGHPKGGVVDGLFEEIDSWFEALSVWVRALADQDVHQEIERRRVFVPAKGLQVLTVDNDVVSLPRAASTSQVVLRNRTETERLDEKRWRHVLNLVGQDVQPPVEYPLLASARAALRLHQFRRTVIDSGTAVELALTHLFDVAVSRLPTSLKEALSAERRTLGPLIDLLATTYKLPTELKPELVKVRNDVIHRNRQPSRKEAAKALELAVKVVKMAKPLPSPCEN